MKIANPIPLFLAIALALACPLSAISQEADSTTSQTTGLHRDVVESVGQDIALKAGDTARIVVAIGGSASVGGHVLEDVVVVGGDAEIDGVVEGNVVVVMGTVRLGPKAVIHHDFVVAGGKADIADGAKVEGQTQEVNVGKSLAPIVRLGWLREWLENCAFKFRPLSLNVEWIWWVAGGFFLLYLLVAVLFRNPVETCANHLVNRPATTFAVGILAKLLIPILCLVLSVTVVGILLVPFVVVGAMLCLVVGKVALLEFLGTKISAPFGLKRGQLPLAQFLIGIVLLTVLYLVPVLGLVTALIFSVWGFGAGVTAAWIALRREKRPATPASPPPSFAPPPSAPPPGPMPFGTPPIGSTPFAQTHSTEPSPSAPIITPPISVLYPRAGFWERMGAGFLDCALLSVVTALVGAAGILVAVAYFAGMWAWKGTTIGGVVLNLQVVREDGQPLSFVTALVRSAAAVFSVLVLFLGFFWIGWDNQKQGWHDKIAGTVVVRLPKAIALVCL